MNISPDSKQKNYKLKKSYYTFEDKCTCLVTYIILSEAFYFNQCIVQRAATFSKLGGLSLHFQRIVKREKVGTFGAKLPTTWFPK